MVQLLSRRSPWKLLLSVLFVMQQGAVPAQKSLPLPRRPFVTGKPAKRRQPQSRNSSRAGAKSPTVGSTTDVKWWKRPLTWVGGIGTAAVIAAATAIGTNVGNEISPHVTGNSTVSQPTSSPGVAPPAVVEDVSASPWDYASFVSPKRTVLSQPQLATLDQQHSNAGFGPTPPGDVLTNEIWIRLTVSGNSSAPVTINNITIERHCQSPLGKGATLFYAPSAGGSMSTSPVYFNLDQPNLLGRSFSGRTGHVGGSFFARRVVTLRYHEPWTFAIFAVIDRYYCQFFFRMSVATTHGLVTETISDHGKPFRLTSDGERTSNGYSSPLGVLFSTYSTVYALSPADSQGVYHYIRVNPMTYRGQLNPAPFAFP